MATSFTIADIIADAAVRSNSPAFGANTRITSAQATYWLGQAVRSWSALMRQKFPEDRELLQIATLPTVAAFRYVSLPTDCGEVHAVIWQRGVNDAVLLKSAQQEDLTDSLEPGEGWTDTCIPRWRLEGQTIALYPASGAVETLDVYYTSNLSYTTSVVARVDFDQWVALDIAIKVAVAKTMPQKAAELRQEKALLENDLLSRARARDVNETHTIRDTRMTRVADYYRRRGF